MTRAHAPRQVPFVPREALQEAVELLEGQAAAIKAEWAAAVEIEGSAT